MLNVGDTSQGATEQIFLHSLTLHLMFAYKANKFNISYLYSLHRKYNI